MQLNKSRRPGQLRDTLATLSLGLVAANTIHVAPAAAQSTDENLSLPYSQLDAAYLSYQEANGRVSASEPTASLAIHGQGGQVLTLGLTADTVSGATPNGAVPSDLAQNFVTPLKASGSSVTVTTASGGSTVITLPPTPGQLAAAALGRMYTVPGNNLPMDRAFYDERKAGTIGWAQPLFGIDQVGASFSYSTERDYSSLTFSGRLAQDFNDHNSTLNLSVNFEDDTSTPYGGVPTPMTAMSGQWKSTSSKGRTQTDVVLGLTEVMSRRWLAQLNVSYGISSGYQNDPYRIVSVVDPVTGEPLMQTDTAGNTQVYALYENRPGSRTRESVYLDNKFDFDPVIPELSLRYYHDSWGISSQTAELTTKIKLFGSFYLTPNVRWYHQSAASFFHYYLLSDQAVPTYASSDSRLGRFTSLTYGAQLGFNLTDHSEIYVRGEYARQQGDGHPAYAVGQLRNQDLFAGIKATWFMVGYSWQFH
ncbi:MAG: DUF3570 domain-containing protein [Alphaproteobacteria bacterium]|nr:DUF3570 domain-containing protein [Alphaproteobacteria bacterium]